MLQLIDRSKYDSIIFHLTQFMILYNIYSAVRIPHNPYKETSVHTAEKTDLLYLSTFCVCRIMFILPDYLFSVCVCVCVWLLNRNIVPIDMYHYVYTGLVPTHFL